MIKKVYQVDPLICKHCNGPMPVISLIEDTSIIERILRHLHLRDKLWDTRNHDPPDGKPFIPELIPDVEKFKAAGIAIVIHANPVIRSIVSRVRETLKEIRETGGIETVS